MIEEEAKVLDWAATISLLASICLGCSYHQRLSSLSTGEYRSIIDRYLTTATV